MKIGALVSAGILIHDCLRIGFFHERACWTRLHGRSALQVLGSAAPALDRLACGAEQAASGGCCGYADREVAGDRVNTALHDGIAAFGAATVLGYLAELLERHLPSLVRLC